MGGRWSGRWAAARWLVAALVLAMPTGAMAQDLTELSAGEAAARIRAGTLKSEDLVRALADVIERRRDLNAFITFDRDRAIASAHKADGLAARKTFAGPLHGVPIVIKDNIHVAGLPNSAGTPALRDFVPTRNAAVAEKLIRAGAIVLGKTNMHELAFGITSNNAAFGPARNAYDPSRIADGSSGGTANAIAARMAAAGLGSDTGGSIRIPASVCGTVGIKPTLGRVSTQGVTPLSRSLDTAGPMAMSVDDAFLLLEGMCGFRPEPAPKPRIVVPKGYFLEECDPRIVDLVSAVGAVEPVDLGDVKAAWDANAVILLSDAASVHENRLRDHPEWFGEIVGQRLKNGLAHRGVDYARARDVQREWTARLDRILEKETVLAVPSTPAPATVIGDREGPALSRLMTRFTSPFNLAGVPVLCVPIGRVDGLPVGLQLVAGAGQESLLKAAAASLRLPSL